MALLPISPFFVLFEIIHADIGPYVSTAIDQYSIDPFDGIEMSRECIVMFDLRGVLLPCNPSFSLRNASAKRCQFIFDRPHNVH